MLELLSVARMTKEKLPLLVGVPETIPLLGLSARPEGRAPKVIANRIGVTPPAVWMVNWYWLPTCPLGGLAEVMLSEDPPCGPATVKLCGCEADIPIASVIERVKGKVPIALGVPVMAPVEASTRTRLSPGGKAPDVMLAE